jgi:hypothetical protein
MSNNSIRIRTTTDNKDKFVKVKLDQEFDFIEVLSLKITQEEVYRNFCADYGVVVGRVFINNGFGIPNARVSIFIPIDDIDKNDPILKGLYPYELVTDKDIDGKRYNLLPKNSETDNDCFTPVGTFPNKREVLDDPEMGHVYCKYYKFTTSTNYAGDYMIFGVPVGNYTVHVDADISDIGIASQRPYDSISQGAPIQMFDSPTKFKGGTNLDKLVQVKTVNAGVNVQPFWGSVENCEIGISRIDLDLNYTITPSAIFMGGAFGDSDKNSVNKNCRPRKSMGKICEQNTSEGTIEMIRKTLDGKIEKLDIEGGRLMDENGSWAYQIPMNLDYYYTNEFGDLVLSEDPNKGIPTRANVRFKIAMDESGGLGRLRTKANYLIPHNPTAGKPDEIDYEFGELTKDSSFRDLYWNKIYSVSNFISRYQKNGRVKNRNFIGLKDVDDCVGDKLPIPFNRVNTVINPLFNIICLIMSIIEFIMFIINSAIIPIINTIIYIVKDIILRLLCGVHRKLKKIGIRVFKIFCEWYDKINYVPCLYSRCPFGESEGEPGIFAPGCIKDGPLSFGKGYKELEKKETGFNINTEINMLSKCVSFVMAEKLNLLQFDFYNDWLNGSLYYFLIKFKKRGRKEKYCNYDCSGANCKSSVLIDTCYNDLKNGKVIGFREGVVKKYNNELFYAPSNKTATFKLFATEIINLGSVFNCDWQGVPKLQEYLIPTTYIKPPIIDEYSEEQANVLDVSGMLDIGKNYGGLFFDINCIEISSDKTQCLNIRHSCEFGVDLNELDETDNGTLLEPDHIVGANEINSEYGKYFRDVFFLLNNVTNNINVNLNPPPTTNFNTNNVGDYNFALSGDNGSDYVNFRGYLDNSSFSQPKHSYYFYFGSTPGATGLDKMNSKFFTKCFPTLTVEFFIRIDNTDAISANNVNDGSTTFTIVSGVGPFTYIVSGPNGYNSSGTLTEPNLTQSLNGLAQGSYIINVTDSSGVSISQSFEISGPTPLYASAIVSNTNTAISSPYNGQITITSVGGGNGTYTASLYNSSNSLVSIGTCQANGASSNPTSVTQTPISFCGLPMDTSPNTSSTHSGNTGYYIIIRDTSSPQQQYIIYNLILEGVSGLNVITSNIKPTCYDAKNGEIKITTSGGRLPYNIVTSSSDSSFVGNNSSSLGQGVYTTTVTDSSSPAQVVTVTTTLLPTEPEMKLEPDLVLLPQQCDPNNYTIYLDVINGGQNNLNQNYTQVNGVTRCYLQFNFDSNEDSDGNPIWGTPQPYTYLNNPTSAGPFRVKVTIPRTQMLASVIIRLSNAQGTCGSDYNEDGTDFDVSQMKLPPNVLSVDVNNVDNTRQCEINFVTFKFNISHLNVFATYRAPYRLEYQIAGQTGVFGTQTIYQTSITQNQQPIRLAVPRNSSNLPSNRCSIKFRVTDNVGCQSSWLPINNIPLPTSSFSDSWSQSTVSGQCIRRYSLSGGIAPYTVTNGFLPNTPYVVSCQPNATSVSGLDNVGCPFNFTYTQ